MPPRHWRARPIAAALLRAPKSARPPNGAATTTGRTPRPHNPPRHGRGSEIGGEDPRKQADVTQISGDARERSNHSQTVKSSQSHDGKVGNRQGQEVA